MRTAVRLLVPALLLLGIAVRSAAQTGDDPARAVVERFLSPDGFPAAAPYAGEMAEHFVAEPTLGETLPPGTRISVRPVEREDARAVFAARVDAGGEGRDYYLYLYRHADGWKLSAVRALALPGVFRAAMEALANAPERSPEDEAELARMHLAVSSDSALAAHFLDNEDVFRRIARRTLRDGPDVAANDLRTARIRTVHRDAEHPGCLFLSVDGMIDNEVGYLHASDGCAAPEISPGRFIYLEHLAPGWWLYKTT